ncbi:uncharacterized protein LOC114529071 [Dendronephthya gigantea]|uniref:uncharacterized protein LOC114529071 n=1 Tax=Dendronephthya gigantea TaxID=151771 RepID=UPI00106B0BC2|nr:uncharacterized protein LOC114529071 [Dendronephthya gigantea]
MAAFYAGSITSNLKFTTKVPLLLKATSNDEKPTQGYDLQEITRISKSSLANCQSLLTFLLGRLEKKDPRIKYKVLHLMKYLVINGHSEFRSQLRHNAEPVKETINFKGELDELHGDGLILKVQQAASELEKLLFDVDNPEVEVIYKSLLAPDQSVSKKMQGFGYTGTLELKKEPSLMDTLMKVKKSGSEILSFNKTKPKIPPSSEFQAIPSTPEPQYTPVDLESSFDDGIEEEDKNSDVLESEMNSDHYYERKLVRNITDESGITKIPSKEMLKDFVNKSLSLELPIILDMLDERLQNPSVIVQLKSLCVIEFLLRSTLANISREIDEHCSSLHLLVESEDLTVGSKAKKIVLAVASCLKQDKEEQASSRVENLVPPSYNDANEQPKMPENNRKDTKQKRSQNTDLSCLFSGMNLSTGTRPDSAGNRKLVEVSETPVETGFPRDSNLVTILDTKMGNSKQNSLGNDKRTTGRSSPNVSFDLSRELIDKKTSASFATARDFDAQNSDKFDLTSLERSGRSHSGLEGGRFCAVNECKTKVNEGEFAEAGCDKAIQNLERSSPQETRKLLLKSKTDMDSDNVDLFSVKTQNSGSNQNLETQTRNVDDLLILSTNKPTTQDLSQNTTSNQDLLTFQTEPRSQALPGGLVLPSNNSSSGSRRPFPKDMKSETDGFDFIRKSRADAFSFINDEIQASKNKPK